MIDKRLQKNLDAISRQLGADESFDVIIRPLDISGRSAAFVYIDGLVKDDTMVRVMAELQALDSTDRTGPTIAEVVRRKLPYLEVTVTDDLEQVVHEALAGPLALFIDGQDRAIIIDARTYPAREPEEPDLERVVRGSRDGFVETLVSNTALIRRRIRDPGLRFDLVTLGLRSRTDTAVAYIKDIASPELVGRVKSRLAAIDIDGLPMAEKTVEELIAGRRYRWNPFPIIRFTERPDVAAVHLLEGHVLILVDTSPSVIVLPATLFHHLQHAEEYRETPIVGAYLRLVRFFGMLAAGLLPPLWTALVLSKSTLPEWLSWIGPRQAGTVPIAWQFVVGDLGLDLLRLALIHTPTALATSLGLIGAVLLGDLAVSVGLISAEAVLYLAVAALGTFATPSMEFGLAVRLSRLFLLATVLLGRGYGLALGVVVLFVYLVRLESFGVPYLWPLVPFNAKALNAVFIRRPATTAGTRPRALRPQDVDRKPERKRR